MAKADFTFRIKLDGRDAVIEAVSNTKKLKKGVDDVAASQAKGTKAARNYNHAQEKGIIGTARNSRDFAKLSKTIGSGDNGLVGAYATLAANTFAVTAAFVALQNAMSVQKVIAGLETQSDTLGVSLKLTANQMKEIVNDTLSLGDAMKSTAMLVGGGFDSSQIKELAVVAKDAAGALGRDVADAMDRLTRGVTKLEPELLDELGIMTKLDEASRKYAIANNKSAASLTAVEKRQAFFNAVIDEGNRKFENIGDSVTEYDAYTRLAATATETLQETMGQLAIVMAPVAEFFASSKLAIVAAVMLFASSIRKSLLPALTEAAETSRKLALDKSKEAKKALQETAAISEKIAETKTGKKIDKNTNMFVSKNEVVVAEKLTTIANKAGATAADYAKTRNEITAIIRQEEQALKSKGRLEERELTRAQNRIATLKEHRAVLDKARKATFESAKANAQAGLQERAQESKNPFNIGLGQGFKEVKAAQLGILGISEADNRIVKATKNMRAFGTATMSSIKAISTVGLNLLPVVGQIMFVTSLLQSAYGFLKDLILTKEQKEYNKAFEDFSSVLEEANGKVSKFAELSDRISPKSAITAIKLHGNFVSELTDKYKALREAREKAYGPELNSETPKTRGDEISDQVNRDRFNSLNIMGHFSGRQGEIVEGVRALNKISKVSTAIVRDRIEAQMASIQAADSEAEKLKLIGEAMTMAGDETSSLAITADNLTESYKNLEEASVKFTQSMIKKTSVDDVVSGLQDIDNYITQLRTNVTKGVLEADAYYKALQDIGSTTVGSMGPDIMRQKIAMDDLIRQIEELELKQKSGFGSPANSRKLKELESDRVYLAQEYGRAIESTVLEHKEIVESYQQQIREAKNLLQLEDARYKAIEGYLGKSGKAFAAAEAHRRSQIELQLKEKRLERDLVDRAIKSKEEEIEASKVAHEKTMATIEARHRADTYNHLARMSHIDELFQFDVDRIATTANLEKQAWSLSADAMSLVVEAAKKKSEQTLEDKNQIALQKELNSQRAIFAANDRRAQSELNNLRASRAALDYEIQAISEQILTNLEEQTGVNAANLELAKEFYAIAENYYKTLNENNKVIREYNRLVSNSSNELIDAAKESQKLYKENYRLLIRSSSVEHATLKAKIEQQKAGIKSREMDELQLEAANLELQNQESRLHNLEKQVTLEAELLSNNLSLELVKLAIFDSVKDTVEWQKQGLEYMEKAVDSETKLASIQESRAATQRKILRIQKGIAESESSAKNDAIAAASLALKNAIRGAEIRAAGIRAEYAMMEAKRQLLMQELAGRKSILEAEAASKGIKIDAYLAPLENAQRLLAASGESLQKYFKSQISILNAEIGQARDNLILAIEEANQNRFKGDDTISRLEEERRQRKELEKLRNEGITLVQDSKNFSVSDSLFEFATTMQSGLKNLPENMGEELKGIFEGKTGVMGEIARDVSSIARAITGTSDGGGLSSGASIKDAADFAARNGFAVTRGPGYGGTPSSGHSEGSEHYSGNAYDINLPDTRGNTEANIPDLKAKMDDLAKKYQAAGFKVIWNRKTYLPSGEIVPYGSSDHDNHLHVEGVPKSVGPAPITGVVDNIKATPGQISNSAETLGAQAPVSGLANTALNSSNTFAPTDPGYPGGSDSPVDPKTVASMADKITEFKNRLAESSQWIVKLAEQLGPDGELVLAISSGGEQISSSLASAFSIFSYKDEDGNGASIYSKIQAVGQVASAVLSSISQVTAATSQQKVRAIDAEIAAEQKRDGKSAESLKKIEALEKKKDQTKRKQFEMNKKIMMAQAVIATATGIAQALSYGPVGIPLAALIGAMGAAQLAIIAGTTYQSSNSTNTSIPKASKVTIGKVGNSSNLDRSNTSAGGEIGYLRGSSGYGTRATNYQTIGSAYGGSTNRGYGHRAFLVGDKGPETIETSEPMTVKPRGDSDERRGDTIIVNATDAQSFERMLEENPAAIAKSLRKVANSSGEEFMPNVDIDSFKGGTKR